MAYPYADPEEALIAEAIQNSQGPTLQGLMDMLAMGTMTVPVVGDVAGLGADALRMYQNPEERTLGNAALASLGVLPFVPPMGAVKNAGASMKNALSKGVAKNAPAVRAGDIGFDPRYDIATAGKPRAGEVERLQNLTANVAERGTQNIPQVSLMDFIGRPFITSMADRTRAGGVLEGVNDVAFNRPVNLQGGQGFMFENPGMVWASGRKPVQDIQELASELKKETGQNPLYLPWQMAPSGGDFASMTGETMLAYADANMPKSIKKDLDKQIKALIPDWKGVSDPSSVDQFRGARDTVRKKIKQQVLDKNFRNQGGLGIGETRLAVGDPNQYNATDGGLMNIGEIFADQPSIMQSGHPAYPLGVPGQGLGQAKEDVRVFQLLQNAAQARQIADPRNPSRPDLRSLEMKPYGGVITEGLLRQIGL